MKKIVIITGAGVLLITVVIIIFVFLQKASSLKTFENQPVTGSSDMRLYNSPVFSFTYSATSQIREGVVQDGVYTVLVSDPNTGARVEIHATPHNNTSLSQINGARRDLGFSSSQITVGKNKDISATQFRGKFSYPTGTSQQLLTVFENRSYIYVITLSYPAAKVKSELEALNQQILSTFQLP